MVPTSLVVLLAALFGVIHSSPHIRATTNITCGPLTCVDPHHSFCTMHVEHGTLTHFHCDEQKKCDEKETCHSGHHLHGACCCRDQQCVDLMIAAVTHGHEAGALVCDGHNCASHHRACSLSQMEHHTLIQLTATCIEDKHCHHYCGHNVTPSSHDHGCCCTTQACINSTLDSLSTAAPATTTVHHVHHSSSKVPTTHTPASQTSTQPPASQTSTQPPAQQTSALPQETTTTTLTTSEAVIPMTTAYYHPFNVTMDGNCTDYVDDVFSCTTFDSLYGICQSSSTVGMNIAYIRCRLTCGHCNETMPVATTTQIPSNVETVTDVCVDHDPKGNCRNMPQLCTESAYRTVAIANCAKTCNLCDEYKQFLQSSSSSAGK